MEENVSYDVRKKRARKLHTIVHRLLKIKKTKEARMAPDDVLKKRARKLARILLRKKLAGEQGKKYAHLSTAQKIAVDELLDRIPKDREAAFAKRLIPIVRRAEQARLASVKKHRSEKLHEYSLKQSNRRQHTAQTRRNRRQAGADRAKQRNNEKGASRSFNKKTLEAMLQRKFPGRKFDSKFMKAVTRAMGKDKSKARQILRQKLKNRKADKRAERVRHSRARYDKRPYDTTGRPGERKIVRDSFQYNFYSDMILEGGDDPKFQKLFIRGLVDVDKVGQYKRIFQNLKQTIKLQRYQDDIADLLDDLIDTIIDDPVMYNRFRLLLQKKRFKKD